MVVKDAASHLGLHRVDRAIAADRLTIRLELLDDVIACELPPPDLPSSTRPRSPRCAFGEVLEKEGIHRALEADMQMRDLAL
jgi:hypothetical protein